MIKIERLCRGCMRQMDTLQPICIKCGYDNSLGEKRSAKCLPMYTILNGRYLLGRVLGEGGFGITYLGMDLVTENRVAIKEYFPVGLASRDMTATDRETLLVMPGEQGMHYREGLQKFAREGENLAHFGELPGIVNARDFFEANGTAYLVMDYIEGQSLKQYMQWYQQNNRDGAPMDYQIAVAFLEPVMKSLAQIHKAGVIHRDISPDNIIVDAEGKVTLIDFGAARTCITDNEHRSMTIMVKRGYAPEEQYRTHGKQGPWTDVYALCATLYHMVSGQLPMDSIERLVQDKLVPLKNRELPVKVPAAVSDVLEKGMAIHAPGRYQTMEELHDELMRAMEEQERLEAEKRKAERRVEKEREEKKRREEESRLYAANREKEREMERRESKRRTEQYLHEQEQKKKEQLKQRLKIGAIAVVFVLGVIFFGVGVVLEHRQAEAKRLAMESESRAESERLKVESEAKAESERLRAESEAKAESERLKAELEAKAESERLKAESEAKAESETEIQYTPGTYSAYAQGISSDVTVCVTFDQTRITGISVDVSGETPGIGGEIGSELCEEALNEQSSEIDGVSGATITSDAFKAALADCISQAKK